MQPGLEGGQERPRILLARGAPFVGAAAANVFFDRIKRRDALQRLACDRRGPGGGEFVKPSADMRPAEGEVPTPRCLAPERDSPRSRRPATLPRTRPDARSAARPCGWAHRHRRRRADRLRPTVGRRAHRPRSGRFWSGRGLDRARSCPFCPRRRRSSRIPARISARRRSCTGRKCQAARPTQSASVERSSATPCREKI